MQAPLSTISALAGNTAFSPAAPAISPSSGAVTPSARSRHAVSAPVRCLAYLTSYRTWRVWLKSLLR